MEFERRALDRPEIWLLLNTEPRGVHHHPEAGLASYPLRGDTLGLNGEKRWVPGGKRVGEETFVTLGDPSMLY